MSIKGEIRNLRARTGAAPLKRPEYPGINHLGSLSPRPHGRGPVEAVTGFFFMAIVGRDLRARTGAAPLKQGLARRLFYLFLGSPRPHGRGPVEA